jgi:hypothetical protein
MIECPACGSRLRPGTLSCTECGIDLSTDAPLPTEPLPGEELPASQADPWARVVEGYEDAELPATATALRITVVRSGRQLTFPLPIHEITLGRLDASHGAFPDLDLTPDGGLRQGVSRYHAKVLQIGNRLFVEDADSANGTFLNDQRLTPHLVYALREGDALQLGKLELVVEFG